MNRANFSAYVETHLLPVPRRGDVVILGSLSSHKSAIAERGTRSKGGWMLFLLPDSPVSNPIEMIFAELKAQLRDTAATTIDGFCQAFGNICALFSPEECPNCSVAAVCGFN